MNAIANARTNALDFIGDIHGHFDKLVALLDRLGYGCSGRTFRHPDGRKVVFLGDYIDRGPKIRETLHLVRGMVDAGDAVAIMGNHEWNAICYATPDGNGGYLRPHVEKHDRQHRATLEQFAAHKDEWDGWIEWMKRLPLYLDLGNARAVHACWDIERLPALADRNLTDAGFFAACGKRGTPEYKAIEQILKGPELHLPEGVSFDDKEGIARASIRARWWNLAEGMDMGEVVLPEPMKVLNHPLRLRHINRLPNYLPDAPPVFFGHYWLPAHLPRKPVAPNLVCLDYSGAFNGNPLTAYRWDGEAIPTADRFISA
jgi:hypothetical protein